MSHVSHVGHVVHELRGSRESRGPWVTCGKLRANLQFNKHHRCRMLYVLLRADRSSTFAEGDGMQQAAGKSGI